MPTRTDTELSIRPLTSADIGRIAEIHCAAFPHAALTKLGREAITRYYLWQLEGPHDESWAFGVWSRGILEGFCFGGIHPDAISGFLNKNKTYLAWHVATHPWLVANPFFRDKITNGLRILTQSFKTARNATPAMPLEPFKRPFDILSIAVNPTTQGRGLGHAMMQEAEEIARQNGFHVMSLFVTPDNDHAIRFYEAGGWERRNARTGIWRGVMEKWLVPKEAFRAQMQAAASGA
ncbi:MAG: GNAT family N-acetyltransferase [Candidatus Eremiobacteraeota bacterium]|nr:GNAT family N-acetyltransferase [Candidatus Eremiobacteraeota bacterium]